MTRLKSATKRPVVSPNPGNVGQSLASMKLADEIRISKYPDFGPFKNKDSMYLENTNIMPSFNDRKLVSSNSLKWTESFSPSAKHHSNFINMNKNRQRKVESALSKHRKNTSSFTRPSLNEPSLLPQTINKNQRDLKVTGKIIKKPNAQKYTFLKQEYYNN